MLRLCQQSGLWGDVSIGESNVTLKTDGCLLTAIAMIRSDFYPYHIYKQPYLRPDELARLPIFNNDGEIIWALLKPILKSDFGVEFMRREYDYFPSIDNKRLKAYCDNPEYGVCIEVRTWNRTRHWLALENSSIFGWATNDPWNGERLWRTVGWRAPYERITGYAVFRKHEKLEKRTADE